MQLKLDNMELHKVSKEFENKLFKRKEIEFVIVSNSVPSRKDVEEIISKKYSTNPENIKIKKIHGKFGTKEFNIIANVYDSEKERDSTEFHKKKDVERRKKPETPKENPKEENKPEEQKSE